MTDCASACPRQRGGVLLRLIAGVALIGSVLAAGLFMYRHEYAAAHDEQARMLATIADLKTRQISAWLEERRSDADMALHDERFAAQTEEWLLSGAPDDATGHNLKAHIQSILRASHYHSVMLLDSELVVRAAAGTALPFNDSLRRAAREALQKSTVTFVDSPEDGGQDQRRGSLTLFAPLRVNDTGMFRTVGLLALSIAPDRYLNPLLDWWPSPASSGATYLIRQQGEQLTYMNGPRDAQQRRLALSVPAEKLLAQQALHNQTTLIEGLDYRRQPVLANARRIPNTDWLLIAKLDKAEVEHAAQLAARKPLLLGGALLALIGSLMGLLWYRSRSRYRLAEIERQVLARHLDYLSKYANDAILLMNDDGKLIEANDKAAVLYGYTHEQLLHLPLTRLIPPELQAENTTHWQQAEQQDGLVFESTHQHHNGSTFPVEVSARIITVDDKRFRQAIIRDISERKKAEDEVVKARDFYFSLLDIFPNPVWRAGIDARCNYFNQAWLDYTGRELAQELGNGWTEGVHPEDLDACMDTYLNAFKAHEPFTMEYRLRRHDGSYHWVTDHGTPFFDQQGIFSGYIGSCYDIQQVKAAEQHMEFLANHDSLTGLPNRVLLHDRIERALASARREGRQVAVLFIDLDRFKTINDTLGHAAGDQVLRSFAERLSNCVRDADTVSRLGGDEFIVVIPELREASDAVPIAQKILDAMATDFRVDGHDVRITPSIGISAFPHDGQDAQTLIMNADAAMYSVKENGRNAIQFHSPTLHLSAHERLNLEYGLRHALAHGEFEMHYQPQLDAQTLALTGFEALLRWRHPSKGLLLPAQFLPVAEENGLMIAIGRWVLRTACADCRAWWQRAMAVPVCVNLSPAQFQHRELLADINATLHDTGLPAALLHLSVTETMVRDATDAARDTLRALHALGIGVTIDNFDPGHPPLEQFRTHSIDTFMLNHKYVRNIAHSSDAAAVTHDIIDMAHREHLKVIAEGVETQDQFDLLSEQGCDAMQGFYFSAALPAARLDEFMQSTPQYSAAASRH